MTTDQRTYERLQGLRRTADTLRRIGPDGVAAAMPILADLLQDPDDGVSSNATKALAELEAAGKKNSRNEPGVD